MPITDGATSTDAVFQSTDVVFKMNFDRQDIHMAVIQQLTDSAQPYRCIHAVRRRQCSTEGVSEAWGICIRPKRTELAMVCLDTKMSEVYTTNTRPNFGATAKANIEY